MEDYKRSLVVVSAVRQLHLFGYENTPHDNELFRKITHSPNGLRLQEAVLKQVTALKQEITDEENWYPKNLYPTTLQHRQLQTVLPVIWQNVQNLTDKEDYDARTQLLIYGSSVLCLEICRPVYRDAYASSPDPYQEQLPALEKEAVKTLQQLTGRKVAITAVDFMALFGVKDPLKEKENLSLFGSISVSEDGKDLHGLVRKHLDSSVVRDPILLMKGILALMWGTILETAKQQHMQFVLMVFGTAVLVTEIERDFANCNLVDFRKNTSEHIKAQHFLPPKFTEHSSVSNIFPTLWKYMTSSKND